MKVWLKKGDLENSIYLGIFSLFLFGSKVKWKCYCSFRWFWIFPIPLLHSERKQWSVANAKLHLMAARTSVIRLTRTRLFFSVRTQKRLEKQHSIKLPFSKPSHLSKFCRFLDINVLSIKFSKLLNLIGIINTITFKNIFHFYFNNYHIIINGNYADYFRS